MRNETVQFFLVRPQVRQLKQMAKDIIVSYQQYRYSKLSLCFAVGFSQRTFLDEK